MVTILRAGSILLVFSLSGNIPVVILMLKLCVLDRRVRNIPQVVSVRRWVSWGSGNLEGEGWVRVGRGVGQGGSVYKQPETEVDDSCHS
jgi:hypothetical protein